MRALMLLLVIGACGEHPRFQMDAPGGDAARLTVDVSTTPNQWVWVPFAGTTCANGTPAGIGINRAPTAGGDLFIYFEGGGACWDTITCTNGAAVNLDVTYDAAKLATDVSGLVVDHASAPAPLDTTTYVFVPYCTGDLHDGTNVMAYPGGPRSTTRVARTRKLSSTRSRLGFTMHRSSGFSARVQVGTARRSTSNASRKRGRMQRSSCSKTPRRSFRSW